MPAVAFTCHTGINTEGESEGGRMRVGAGECESEAQIEAEAEAAKPQPQRHIDATTRYAPLPHCATTPIPNPSSLPLPLPPSQPLTAVQHYTFVLFFLKTASSWSFSWLLFNFSVGFSSVFMLPPCSPSLSLYLCRAILAAPCCCY